MYRKPGRAYLFLLAYIVLVILYHFVGYTGHFGYDDVHYAQLAADLLKGKVNFEDHYLYRFPVILFTALFYLIFGISDLSSSLPALIITLIILVMVFYLLKERGPLILVLGLSLCSLSNWFLFYSDKLMPDMFVVLSVLWALATIHRYKFISNKSKPALHAFLLALALLFGFMSKGTIVLVLPLLIFLLVTDLLYRRDLKFWGYSLLSGIFLLSVYLLIIWIFTGELLKRFEAIADNSYLNLCSYDQQSLKILLKRVFFGFFGLSIYQALATPFIFILATLFQRRGLHIFRMDDSHSFFLASSVILFLSASFMTISVTSYAPMCLDPRHYLYLVPVASIPASRIIGEYLESGKPALQMILVLVAVSLISYFLQGDSFWKLYFPLTVLVLLYYFVNREKKTRLLFLFLFTIILLLLPLDMISYARQLKYTEQKEIVKEQVLKMYPDHLIITDEVQKRLLEYYCGFDGDQMGRFLSFDQCKPGHCRDTLAALNGGTLLLLNWHTRYLSGMETNDLPPYARNIPGYIDPVFESREPELFLYDMEDLVRQDRYRLPLVTSCNDFETSIPFWKQNEKDLTGDVKYEGAKANRVTRYSSTFDYPLDTLFEDNPPMLLVSCRLHCYAEDRSDAKLVVSIETDGRAAFWEALEMNRYIKAYSNWWPVSFEVMIPPGELKPSSSLKVYVWKTDRPAVFIDNFCISISAMEAEIPPE